jgi:hypothetical protein
MVSYAAGSCSPAEKADFELHCLSCDECLATLAIILRLLHFPVGEEEEMTLALLYPIGMEAARVALKTGMKVSTSDGEIPLLESPFSAVADGGGVAGQPLQFWQLGSFELLALRDSQETSRNIIRIPI